MEQDSFPFKKWKKRFPFNILNRWFSFQNTEQLIFLWKILKKKFLSKWEISDFPFKIRKEILPTKYWTSDFPSKIRSKWFSFHNILNRWFSFQNTEQMIFLSKYRNKWIFFQNMEQVIFILKYSTSDLPFKYGSSDLPFKISRTKFFPKYSSDLPYYT